MDVVPQNRIFKLDSFTINAFICDFKLLNLSSTRQDIVSKVFRRREYRDPGDNVELSMLSSSGV